MTAPCAVLASLEDTSWYHCVCYCVRRAFLCSGDPFSGLDFDYLRSWIAERIHQLAALFAIEPVQGLPNNNHFWNIALAVNYLRRRGHRGGTKKKVSAPGTLRAIRIDRQSNNDLADNDQYSLHALCLRWFKLSNQLFYI